MFRSTTACRPSTVSVSQPCPDRCRGIAVSAVLTCSCRVISLDVDVSDCCVTDEPQMTSDVGDGNDEVMHCMKRNRSQITEALTVSPERPSKVLSETSNGDVHHPEDQRGDRQGKMLNVTRFFSQPDAEAVQTDDMSRMVLTVGHQGKRCQHVWDDGFDVTLSLEALCLERPRKRRRGISAEMEMLGGTKRGVDGHTYLSVDKSGETVIGQGSKYHRMVLESPYDTFPSESPHGAEAKTIVADALYASVGRQGRGKPGGVSASQPQSTSRLFSQQFDKCHLWRLRGCSSQPVDDTNCDKFKSFENGILPRSSSYSSAQCVEDVQFVDMFSDSSSQESRHDDIVSPETANRLHEVVSTALEAQAFPSGRAHSPDLYASPEKVLIPNSSASEPTELCLGSAFTSVSASASQNPVGCVNNTEAGTELRSPSGRSDLTEYIAGLVDGVGTGTTLSEDAPSSQIVRPGSAEPLSEPHSRALGEEHADEREETEVLSGPVCPPHLRDESDLDGSSETCDWPGPRTEAAVGFGGDAFTSPPVSAIQLTSTGCDVTPRSYLQGHGRGPLNVSCASIKRPGTQSGDCQDCMAPQEICDLLCASQGLARNKPFPTMSHADRIQLLEENGIETIELEREPLHATPTTSQEIQVINGCSSLDQTELVTSTSFMGIQQSETLEIDFAQSTPMAVPAEVRGGFSNCSQSPIEVLQVGPSLPSSESDETSQASLSEPDKPSDDMSPGHDTLNAARFISSTLSTPATEEEDGLAACSQEALFPESPYQPGLNLAAEHRGLHAASQDEPARSRQELYQLHSARPTHCTRQKFSTNDHSETSLVSSDPGSQSHDPSPKSGKGVSEAVVLSDAHGTEISGDHSVISSTCSPQQRCLAVDIPGLEAGGSLDTNAAEQAENPCASLMKPSAAGCVVEGADTDWHGADVREPADVEAGNLGLTCVDRSPCSLTSAGRSPASLASGDRSPGSERACSDGAVSDAEAQSARSSIDLFQLSGQSGPARGDSQSGSPTPPASPLGELGGCATSGATLMAEEAVAACATQPFSLHPLGPAGDGNWSSANRHVVRSGPSLPQNMLPIFRPPRENRREESAAFPVKTGDDVFDLQSPLEGVRSETKASSAISTESPASAPTGCYAEGSLSQTDLPKTSCDAIPTGTILSSFDEPRHLSSYTVSKPAAIASLDSLISAAIQTCGSLKPGSVSGCDMQPSVAFSSGDTQACNARPSCDVWQSSAVHVCGPSQRASARGCDAPQSVAAPESDAPQSVAAPGCDAPHSVVPSGCDAPQSVTALGGGVPQSVAPSGCDALPLAPVARCGSPQPGAIPCCDMPESAVVPSCDVSQSAAIPSRDMESAEMPGGSTLHLASKRDISRLAPLPSSGEVQVSAAVMPDRGVTFPATSFRNDSAHSFAQRGVDQARELGLPKCSSAQSATVPHSGRAPFSTCSPADREDRAAVPSPNFVQGSQPPEMGFVPQCNVPEGAALSRNDTPRWPCSEQAERAVKTASCVSGCPIFVTVHNSGARSDVGPDGGGGTVRDDRPPRGGSVWKPSPRGAASGRISMAGAPWSDGARPGQSPTVTPHCPEGAAAPGESAAAGPGPSQTAPPPASRRIRVGLSRRAQLKPLHLVSRR